MWSRPGEGGFADGLAQAFYGLLFIAIFAGGLAAYFAFFSAAAKGMAGDDNGKKCEVIDDRQVVCVETRVYTATIKEME